MAGDKMDIVDNGDEHSIKPAPEKASAVPDTTDWPLLLKNYSELAIRTSHFTPIPHGSAPFKRDIKSYVSSGVINLVSLPGEDERANSLWENARGCSERGSMLTEPTGQTVEPVVARGRRVAQEDASVGTILVC